MKQQCVSKLKEHPRMFLPIFKIYLVASYAKVLQLLYQKLVFHCLTAVGSFAGINPAYDSCAMFHLSF
jgi:hypothetical protein